MIVLGTGRKLSRFPAAQRSLRSVGTLGASAVMLLAGCGLARNGVPVAPRRAGLDLARYTQTRDQPAGALTITVVTDSDRDQWVSRAIDRAFVAGDSAQEQVAVTAAVASLRADKLDDFEVEGPAESVFAGDDGGQAWKVEVQDRRGGHTVAEVAVRDQAVSCRGGDSSTVTVFASELALADVQAASPASTPGAGIEEVLVDGSSARPVMTVTAGLKKRLILSTFDGEVKWLPPVARQ